MRKAKPAPGTTGGTLYQALPKLFGTFLAQRGFECISYKLNRELQLELIDFTSPDIRLRLTCEQDHFFAYLALPEKRKDWIGVQSLYQVLGIDADETAQGMQDMTVFATMLAENFGRMLALLRPENLAQTRASMAAFSQDEVTRFLDGQRDPTLH